MKTILVKQHMFIGKCLKNSIFPLSLILILILSSSSLFSEIFRLESQFINLEISSDDGSYKIYDKKSGVLWESNPRSKRFCEAVVVVSGRRQTIELSKCRIVSKENKLELTFNPLADEQSVAITVNLTLQKTGDTIEFSYNASPSTQVERISLLDNSLWVKNSDNGYLIVPVREGLIIPSNSGLNFEHSFGTYTYEGCHMAMFGIVKNGSALLVNWDNPYTTLQVKSITENTSQKSQILLPSLVLSKTSQKIQIKFLGKGGYVEVGKSYREFAKQKGWLITWEQKLRENPNRALLFGAANIKLWSLLSRHMSEDSSKEISKSVNWTFDEAAEVAEHIKNDLKIDKALLTIGGWIHRGYDNQHPDILPAAPECGGNEKLSECAKRIMKLGYLFCLHDNYQDIYRDSPSWNEDYIMKNQNGSLVAGGVWAGGRAYLTCSLKALELAKRPQNLPEVKRLTQANSYFIDTTYAAGLYECFDSKHPLTRIDDIKWKQALSDYARSLFGIFGSECGREWAIPHSDFFEGLTGVSGRHYHDAGLENKLGAFVVPLFEIVYRDCIAMYGKYGYNPANSAEYVLDHIIFGRPLNYHNIPTGLYWTKKELFGSEAPIKPFGVDFKPIEKDLFEIRYKWECHNVPQTDWRIFVHFTDAKGKILFQNDHAPETPIAQWKPGSYITGPFKIKIPPEALSAQKFEIRVGMFFPEKGIRAKLIGTDDGEQRYILGRITVKNDTLTFEPQQPPVIAPSENPGIFATANNGWGEGLHPFDIFLKNTCEILNPLNEITSQMLLIKHEFLKINENGEIISSKEPESELIYLNKKIQRSVFGSPKNLSSDLLEVVVNSSEKPCSVISKYGGEVILPKYGFLIESPQFIAFNAIKWNGIVYETPTMFTIKSLSKKSIKETDKIRVFHSFGNDTIKIGSRELKVKKEMIISQ